MMMLITWKAPGIPPSPLSPENRQTSLSSAPVAIIIMMMIICMMMRMIIIVIIWWWSCVWWWRWSLKDDHLEDDNDDQYNHLLSGGHHHSPLDGVKRVGANTRCDRNCPAENCHHCQDWSELWWQFDNLNLIRIMMTIWSFEFDQNQCGNLIIWILGQFNDGKFLPQQKGG